MSLSGIIKRILPDKIITALRRLRIALPQSLAAPAVRADYRRLRAEMRGDVGMHAHESKRTRPRVLFVSEKWCDQDPNIGPTNSQHNFWGSLEASGLAEQDHFFFDEYYHLHNRPGDSALLAHCMTSKPDLLFLTWGLNLPHNPRWETLKLLRGMGIPTVAVWYDSVHPITMDYAEALLRFVDLNVILDTAKAPFEKTRQAEKYLPMWTPQDPRIFNNPNAERDIDISFVGSMQGYPDRQAHIAALRASGIDVYQGGGQRENHLSPEDYADIHKRSKIALSFPRTRFGNYVQTKGRIFEATLCGAMLLDAENDETSGWLEPMVDYVPFADEADLVDKARYYLEHAAERTEIAMRGHQKVQTRYTGETFWRAILGTLFDTAR